MTTAFVEELRQLINRHSIDSFCDTPDHTLANLLADNIRSFRNSIHARSMYNGEAQKNERIKSLESKISKARGIME